MARNFERAARNFRYAMGLSMDPNRGESVRKAGQDYRAALARTQRVNATVLALLRRVRVVPSEKVFYLACAQQLDRARRKHTCLVLAREARVRLDYWRAYGLDPVVLEAVARAVLGFVPADPGERPCGACSRGRSCRLRLEPPGTT